MFRSGCAMKKLIDALCDLIRFWCRSEKVRFLLAIVAVVLVWISFFWKGSEVVTEYITGVSLNKLSASDAAALRGLSGDAFGSFGALFSALSSVLFALSFYFQFKKDNKQKFEGNFFQLLAGHREIVAAAVYYNDGGGELFSDPPHARGRILPRVSRRNDFVEAKGKACFYHIFGLMKKDYKALKGAQKAVLPKHGELNDTRGIAAAAAERVTKEYGSELHHYFRNMYYVVDYIDNAEGISDTEKRFYASLFRAQLSSYEIALLFYNGITEIGEEKFKRLIERYSLLRNLDLDLLFSVEHRSFYVEAAYWSEEEARSKGVIKN